VMASAVMDEGSASKIVFQRQAKSSIPVECPLTNNRSQLEFSKAPASDYQGRLRRRFAVIPLTGEHRRLKGFPCESTPRTDCHQGLLFPRKSYGSSFFRGLPTQALLTLGSLYDCKHGKLPCYCL
jgi:hypothetical protein